MTRNDVHRPSVIEPLDYEYVGIEYMRTDDDLGAALFLAEERKRIRAHMERTGGSYSRHQHGGNCHICGAHAIYTALFFHVPSCTYIRTGFECAEKLDGGNEDEFRAFRAAVHDARANQAGKNKARVLLDDMGLSRAWDLYRMDLEEIERDSKYEAASMEPYRRCKCGSWNGCEKCDYSGVQPNRLGTVCDIVARLVRWGGLSEAAERYLRNCVEYVDRYEEILAERAAEKARAADCPEGRVKVVGTVLKKEWRENAYGGSLKMTVKSDEGFVVWGGAPSAIQLVNDQERVDLTYGDVCYFEDHGRIDEVHADRNGAFLCHDIQRGLERGDRVEFMAAVTPSDRDPKFGFFKRPTKARLI